MNVSFTVKLLATFLVFLALLFLFSFSSQNVFAECTGSIDIGNTLTLNSDGSLSCNHSNWLICESLTTKAECDSAADKIKHGKKVDNIPDGACYINGNCVWIDPPSFSNPSPKISPIASCSSVGGKCLPISSSCGGNADFAYSCGTDSAFCCLNQKQQCTDVNGAVCTTQCNGSSIDTVACKDNSGQSCCIQDSDSSAPVRTRGGESCSSSEVQDETYNQCGCSAGGVTIPGDESVKVEKFHYSNASCSAGPQFACGTATKCTNGCSGGVCIEDQPKECAPGKKPGDQVKDAYVTKTSTNPDMCKKIVEKYTPNCSTEYDDAATGKPADQVDPVDCATLGVTPEPVETSPTGAANAKSSVCNASYTINPTSPASNSSMKVDITSISSDNIKCVVLYKDGVFNDGDVSCTSTAAGKYNCTIKDSGTAGSKHELQLKFGQSKYYSGVECGQEVACNTASYTVKDSQAQIAVASVDTLDTAIKTPQEWLSCYDELSCKNSRTADINQDGKINILDFNFLLNK